MGRKHFVRLFPNTLTESRAPGLWSVEASLQQINAKSKMKTPQRFLRGSVSRENPLELPMKSSGSRANNTSLSSLHIQALWIRLYPRPTGPLPLLAWKHPTLYLGSHIQIVCHPPQKQFIKCPLWGAGMKAPPLLDLSPWDR